MTQPAVGHAETGLSASIGASWQRMPTPSALTELRSGKVRNAKYADSRWEDEQHLIRAISGSKIAGMNFCPFTWASISR